MEVPSLYNLAMEAVAQGFNTGKYKESVLKLTPSVSDDVFDCVRSWASYPTIQAEWLKNLTLERVAFSKVETVDLAIMKQQKRIKSLTFQNVSLDIFFHPMIFIPQCRFSNPSCFQFFLNTGATRNCNCPVKLHITELIWYMTNVASRQTIRQLSLCDKHLEPHWPINIGKMLPQLTHLECSECRLTDEQIVTIFDSFQNLKYLNVRKNAFKSFDGIEKLRHLEFLCIQEVEIQTAEGFAKLCAHENLKILDISHLKSWVFERLQQCITHSKIPVLPKIEEIYLIRVVRKSALLNEFCKSMAHIKKLHITGTNVELADDLETGSIKIVSCRSYNSTIACLRTYMYMDDNDFSVYPLRRLDHKYLSEFKDNQDMKSRRELISFLCHVLNKSTCNEFLTAMHCSKVLSVICDIKTVVKMTGDERLELCRTYFNCHAKLTRKGQMGEMVHKYFWTLFSTYDFFYDFLDDGIHTNALFTIGLELLEARDAYFFKAAPFILRTFVNLFSLRDLELDHIGKDAKERLLFYLLNEMDKKDDLYENFELEYLTTRLIVAMVKHSLFFCEQFTSTGLIATWGPSLKYINDTEQFDKIQILVAVARGVKDTPDYIYFADPEFLDPLFRMRQDQRDEEETYQQFLLCAMASSCSPVVDPVIIRKMNCWRRRVHFTGLFKDDLRSTPGEMEFFEWAKTVRPSNGRDLTPEVYEPPKKVRRHEKRMN